MPGKSHLPLAVHYNADTLVELGDMQLLVLIDECDRWFGRMDEFKSALATKVAITEWVALTRHDLAQVAASTELLKAEYEARLSEDSNSTSTAGIFS